MDRLTFSQAQAYEDLPTPLKLEELTRYARTQIWNVLYAYLHATKRSRGAAGLHLGPPWLEIAAAVHAVHLGRPADEWFSGFHDNSDTLKVLVQADSFNSVFDLLQFIMQQPKCPPSFVSDLQRTFDRCHLAYAILDSREPVIVPTATPTEGKSIEGSMVTLASAGLQGSVSHLRESAMHINNGNWAASVRDSIHAVESVARQLTPENANTLGPALRALEREGALHPAFKEGIRKLYGYTCDEKGIRHALIDHDRANVTRDEAVFMLGACASFASYLWRKSRGGSTS